MKTLKKGVLALAVLLSVNTKLKAQEDASNQKTANLDMSLTLNSDIFFGFYPFFTGSYGFGEKVDFTFYGIQWSGGTGAGWGNWTEFGIGIGFDASDYVYINPQIGVLNGSLTSGLGTPVLAEGVVPNLTIGLDNEKLEGEFYIGYYLGLDHGNATTNNYLHYWLNGGYKITNIVSLGLHYEHLRFTGGEGHADDAAYDYYQSVGPYIQFSKPNGSAFTRFSTGFDLRSQEQIDKSNWEQPSFYKLTLGFDF
jgi:hypothetical protein